MTPTDKQTATILAALRYWQQELIAAEASNDPDAGPISEEFLKDQEPLTADEVEELIQEIQKPAPEVRPDENDGFLLLAYCHQSGESVAMKLGRPELLRLRTAVIEARDAVLQPGADKFDAESAVMLSHIIALFSTSLDGKGQADYERTLRT